MRSLGGIDQSSKGWETRTCLCEVNIMCAARSSMRMSLEGWAGAEPCETESTMLKLLKSLEEGVECETMRQTGQ